MKSLLLLLLATTAFTQTHTLRYKVTKGQTIRYNYATNISSTQTMSGSEQTFEIGTTMTIGIKADELWKDSLGFIATAEKVKIDLPEIMKEMMEKSDPAKGLEGKRTHYTFSPLGKQLSEKNLDSIKGLGSMVRGVGSSIPFSLLKLPEQAVAVGASWTEPGDLSKAGRSGMKMTKVPSTTYTFEKIVDTLGYKCARIVTSTKGATAGAGEAQQGINMSMTGDITASGIYYFALKDGILVAMKQNYESDGTISVTGQMSMVIPTHQEVTTTMAIVK